MAAGFAGPPAMTTRRRSTQCNFDEFDFRFKRLGTCHAAFRSRFAIAARAKPITCDMSIEPEPWA